MSTDIVSIDVGIRNLAYCIMRLNAETIQIVAWNIIDLAATAPKCAGFITPRARSINKEPMQCQKPPLYDAVGITYCATCAARANILIPSRDHCATALRRRDTADLIILAKSLNCVIELTTKTALVAAITMVYQARSATRIRESVSGKTIDAVNIARAIMRELDAVPLFAGASRVIIENQMGPQAVRMKGVQGMLTQYFVMRNPNVDVKFVSSGNKLKLFSNIETKSAAEESASPLPLVSGKIKYAARKLASVKHTSAILTQSSILNDWISIFSASRKKDDFADCFLQLVWFLHSINEITLDRYILTRARII